MSSRFHEWLPWRGFWLSMAATPGEVRTREELLRAKRQPSCASVWDSLPADVPAEEIGCVMLLGQDYPDHLPSVLDQLPHLTTLSIPAHLVPQIGPRVASRLLELVVVGSVVKLPPHSFPKLGVLRCNDAEVDLEVEQVPALERLSLRKPSAKMQMKIEALARLWGLRVGPIGQKLLPWVASLRRLQCLTINGGRLSDVSPLADCLNLRQIEFIALPMLKTIKPLGRLIELDELGFNQCTAISNVDALLDLPLLKRVAFYASGSGRTYTRVLRALAARGIAVWPSLD